MSALPTQELLARTTLRIQSDQRLIHLYRAGSERAFETLVERHRAALVRYCARLVDHDMAEDVVQQTFERALSKMSGSSDAIRDPKAWLYRVAHDATVDAIRRKASQAKHLSQDLESVATPDLVIDRRNEFREVLELVKGLPDRQRYALIQRELEGRSYEEIATALRGSPRSIAQLIYRARQHLRDGLGVLIPVWLLRPLVNGSRSAGGELRVGELVAGAGAGGAAVKTGVALLVVGAASIGVGAAVDRDSGERRQVAGSASPTQTANSKAKDAHPKSRHAIKRNRHGNAPGSANDAGPSSAGPNDNPGRDRDSSKDGTDLAAKPSVPGNAAGSGGQTAGGQAASPGSVSSQNNTVFVSGGPAQDDRISVSRSSSRYLIEETGGGSLRASAPCVNESAAIVTCPGSIDTLHFDAGDGNDTATVIAQPLTAVTVDGGAGDDTLSVDSENGDNPTGTVLEGGPGNDLITGSRYPEVMRGGEGNDVLSGGGGIDWLFGQGGDDRLSGGADPDLILGNDGDDSLDGGTGGDRIDGGLGSDFLDARDGDGDQISCNSSDSGRADSQWLDPLPAGCALARP